MISDKLPQATAELRAQAPSGFAQQRMRNPTSDCKQSCETQIFLLATLLPFLNDRCVGRREEHNRYVKLNNKTLLYMANDILGVAAGCTCP